MWNASTLVALALVTGVLAGPSPASWSGQAGLAPGETALAVPGLQAPSPEPGVAPPPQLVDQVRQDLARRLGVSMPQVTLVEAMAKTWSSLALGCPAPGLAYAAVETPGFALQLDALGQRYAYHTDTRATFVACLQGQGVPSGQVLGASGLLAALLERGVRVEVVDAYAELPFLRADGTRYRLAGAGLPEGAEIQVYAYDDPGIAAADVARIGPDGQPTAGRVEWSRPPRFFASGSVLVVTFESDQRLLDQLTELLGPQAAGPVASDLPPAPAGPGAVPPTPTGGQPSSMPGADPSVPRISWEEAKALIASGAVRQVFQTHALEVRLTLKDGRSFVTTESRIDEVFEVVRACGAPCADTLLATE